MRISSKTGLPIIPKLPPAPSSRCGDAPPPKLRQGIALFNAGDYFACHEVLEELWRGETDPIRSLYQGILLVGVGYLHLERGNKRGALAKFSQGVDRLLPFVPSCQGVDVAALIRNTRPLIDDLRGGKLPRPPQRPEVGLNLLSKD